MKMNANAALLVVLAITVGCVVGCVAGGFPDGVGADVDGGPEFSGDDCVPIGVDAGPDAGVECAPALDAAQSCEALVAQTCGATCGESPGCAAATLLQTYEPERCAEALADSQTFPTCELGNCDTLVAKVCGDDEACLDAPGCAPALELQSRGADPDATQDELEAAAAECLQALEDDVIFSSCTE
jgi:hypothetical protein